MGLFDVFKSKPVALDNKPKLMCKPGDPASYKCIYLASYRGFPVNVEWVRPSSLHDHMARSIISSNIEQLPRIEDNGFVVCGSKAVLTYLNTKGGAPSLHPRKARVLAMQQYWIELLERFSNLIENEHEPAHQQQIDEIIKLLDDTLSTNKYIVKEWSLADIHWLATFKSMDNEEKINLLEKFKNISQWFQRLESEAPVNSNLLQN